MTFYFSFIIQVVEDTTNTYPRWMGFGLSLALFISSMMKSFFWNFAQYHQMTIGLKMKTAIIGVVYRKVSENAYIFFNIQKIKLFLYPSIGKPDI